MTVKRFGVTGNGVTNDAGERSHSAWDPGLLLALILALNLYSQRLLQAKGVEMGVVQSWGACVKC
jgi:hypothetical protein